YQPDDSVAAAKSRRISRSDQAVAQPSRLVRSGTRRMVRIPPRPISPAPPRRYPGRTRAPLGAVLQPAISFSRVIAPSAGVAAAALRLIHLASRPALQKDRQDQAQCDKERHP